VSFFLSSFPLDTVPEQSSMPCIIGAVRSAARRQDAGARSPLLEDAGHGSQGAWKHATVSASTTSAAKSR
jgi:hypothetical protein